MTEMSVSKTNPSQAAFSYSAFCFVFMYLFCNRKQTDIDILTQEDTQEQAGSPVFPPDFFISG